MMAPWPGPKRSAGLIALGVGDSQYTTEVRTMTTARGLQYNGYTHALVRYPNGEPALWVQDEYLAGRSDTPGTYTINDCNSSEPIDADEDLDAITEQWCRDVEWDEV